MMDHAVAGEIGRVAAVTSPGVTVMAAILFMGRVSGPHVNPAVTIGFALRGDFPSRRRLHSSWAGGGRSGSVTAQGTIDNEGQTPGQGLKQLEPLFIVL